MTPFEQSVRRTDWSVSGQLGMATAKLLQAAFRHHCSLTGALKHSSHRAMD